MKISEQFRVGKALLWRGRGTSRYWQRSIHSALMLMSEGCAGHEAYEAFWIIEDRLGYVSDVEWLLSKGVPSRAITRVRLQQWRHAWLDQLIAEFEERGQ